MNEPHFVFFMIYMIDLHNHHIQKTLRQMCNPMSAARYEFIAKLNIEVVDENTVGFMPQTPFSRKDANKKTATTKETVVLSPTNQNLNILYKKTDCGEFKCELCDKKYKQLGYLKTHLKTKHDKCMTIYCELCHVSFYDLVSLSRHQKCKGGCPNVK
jgi:hypothetical protein